MSPAKAEEVIAALWVIAALVSWGVFENSPLSWALSVKAGMDFISAIYMAVLETRKLKKEINNG